MERPRQARRQRSGSTLRISHEKHPFIFQSDFLCDAQCDKSSMAPKLEVVQVVNCTLRHEGEGQVHIYHVNTEVVFLC